VLTEADFSRVNLSEDLDTPRVVPSAADEIVRSPKTSRALALPTPAYAHLPLVLGPAGKELGKRDDALPLETLDEARLRATLAFALRALEGQEPREGTPREILEEARARFSPHAFRESLGEHRQKHGDRDEREAVP
jgi:glutamyl-Q tRNA(Asp) synthetase